MRRSVCRLAVAVSLLIAWAGLRAGRGAAGPAAMRPRYGGSLRVEVQARVLSLAPVQPGKEFRAVGAASELRCLVYDRLVRLDSSGRTCPALAQSWERDTGGTKWQFKLRPNVKWHDGSPLTLAEAAEAINGDATERRWSVVANALEADAEQSRPDFPALLAAVPGRQVMKKAQTELDTPPLGTGPFRLVQWEANRRAVFAANEDYWGGRPYVDSIQVEMGRPSREQLIDLELDKADVVELDPGEARRAQQEGRRVWASQPVELLCLRFNLSRPSAQDRRLREALAFSVDRSAIQKVLLRNFGDVAGGIFPPWLSGYAFLFPTVPDLARARQLGSALASPPTVDLGYNADDALARQVAERVAVNARDAGILVEVAPLSEEGRRRPESVDALLVRARIAGPSLAQAALEAAAQLQFPSAAHPNDPQEVYLAERRFLQDFGTLPLVFTPELVGLGPRVRDWMADRWGDWHLDEVWMEAAK